MLLQESVCYSGFNLRSKANENAWKMISSREFNDALHLEFAIVSSLEETSILRAFHDRSILSMS